jgi:hypothetical protein
MAFWAVVISACNSSKDEESVNDKKCCITTVAKEEIVSYITGKWKWIETSYYADHYGQLVKNPMNTGKNLSYIFTGDTLIITSDNKIIEKSTYEIGLLKELTNFQQDTMLYIRLKNNSNTKLSLLHICGDSLVLVNSYNNLGGNVKLRKEG